MKKISKFIVSILAATGMFLLQTKLAFAEDMTIKINELGDEYKGITTLSFPLIVTGGIRLIIVIAAIVFFFVLVVGGIQWIVSGGDKAGAETARKRITAALVGLAIVFVAWAIASLIKALFNFDIFNLTIKPLAS